MTDTRPTLADLARAHRAATRGQASRKPARRAPRLRAPYPPGQHPLDLTAGRAAVHDQVAELLTAGAGFTVTFTVPGTPVPKARPRWAADPETGEQRTYTPARTVNAEQAVRDCCTLALRGAVPPTVGAWGVTAVFYLPDRRIRDSDNLLKLVKDALNGVTWADDAQVTADFVSLQLDPQRPRSVITVWQTGAPGAAGDRNLRRGGYQPAPVHATIGGPVPVDSTPEDAPGHAKGPPNGEPITTEPGLGPASPYETTIFSSKRSEPR